VLTEAGSNAPDYKPGTLGAQWTSAGAEECDSHSQ